MRDWRSPIAKVLAEGECRACGATDELDPAHLFPRGLGGSNDPENIVPLCRTCHREFDAGDFDLGSVKLTPRERVCLVAEAAAHGRDGVDYAHRRLFPSHYTFRNAPVPL